MKSHGDSYGFGLIGWLSARQGTALEMHLEEVAQRRICPCGTLFYTSTERQKCLACQKQSARLVDVVRLVGRGRRDRIVPAEMVSPPTLANGEVGRE